MFGRSGLACVAGIAGIMCVNVGAHATNGLDEKIRGAAAEARLGYTADAIVYPPSLNGHGITVYRDPSDTRQRRFVKPVFMPSWKSFEEAIIKVCDGADGNSVKTVPLKVQFASKKINEEIATQLAKSDSSASLDKIFTYPVYALFVTSGSQDPADNVSTKVQFRYPPGISEVLPSGIVAATDFPLTGLGIDPPIRISETCDNLQLIYKFRDLNALIYTEYAEVKINAVSVIYSNFVKSEAFKELDRDEAAAGVIRISSRSGKKGIGFNLGNFNLAATKGSTSNQAQDTRSRAVSASLMQDIAHSSAFYGQVYQRVEADLFSPAVVVDKLLDFTLGNAEAFTALFERNQTGQLEIVQGAWRRTLSPEDTKTLLESAPIVELNASGKTTVDCAMVATAATGTVSEGKQCGTEHEQQSKYANTIKWDRQGTEWIPTSVQLYAISTQELKQSAAVGVETAMVKSNPDAQVHVLVHVTDAEPTEYVKDMMDERVAQLISKIDGPAKHVVTIPGGHYRTISYWGNNYNASRTYECIATPSAPGKDYTRIAGAETVYDSRKNILIIAYARKCGVSQGCNRAGEYCAVYGRTAGCWVNNSWLEWYRARKKNMGAAPTNEEICAPPL